MDGIICITGEREGQELVIKLHEKLHQQEPLPLVVMSAPPPSPPISIQHQETRSTVNSAMGLCLKISPDGRHSDVAMAPESDDEHSQSRDSEPDMLELSMNDNMNTSMHMDQECEDKLDKNSDDSPSGSDAGGIGPKGVYLGKLPFLSSTSFQQKRLPLRSDRWTPNTPLPSTPECKHCGYTFANYEVLSEHNEAVHSVFTCPYCFKTFTSRSNLERHSRLHTGHRPYVCSLCGKAFSRKDHLTNHSTKHAFKCGTCLKRFADKKQLSQHYNVDHSTSLSQVCEFCNKGFATMASYEDHIKTHPQYHATRKGRRSPGSVSQPISSNTTTGGIKRLLCRLCSFSCNDRITLLKHKMVHSESQRCFTCLACAKMFGNPLEYSNHLFTHTTETNIFECCICRQLCPSLESLKKHELIHLNDQILPSGHVDPALTFFSCPQCDSTFQSVTNLQEHMEIHESANKFKCPVCSQGFPSYTDLWNHTEDLKHYTQLQSTEEGKYMMEQYAQNLSTDAEPNNYSKEKLQEMDQMEDSDIEIVEPQAPEDMRGERIKVDTSYNEDYTSRDASSSQLDDEYQDNMSIKMEPVRSLLSRTAPRKQERPQKLRDNHPDLQKLRDNHPDLQKLRDNHPELKQLRENHPELKQLRDNHPELKQLRENHPELKQLRDDHSDLQKLRDSHPELLRKMLPDPEHVSTYQDDMPQDLSKKRKRIEPPVPVKDQHVVMPTEHVAQASPRPYLERLMNGTPEKMPHNVLQDIPPERPQFPALPEFIEIVPDSDKHPGEVNLDTSQSSLDVKPMLVTEPPTGPFTCTCCTEYTTDTFLELESHCFSKHSRSPCMYCPKTFAQKANRDRHVCLHTGEKPYSCPECSEKFSRGDKLKIHRTKVHNVSYPANSRVRDGSSKDWSMTSSPSTVVDRSSVSPSPALGNSSVNSGDSSHTEEWNGSVQSSEAVHASGEWTVHVENMDNGQTSSPKDRVSTRSQSKHITEAK